MKIELKRVLKETNPFKLNVVWNPLSLCLALLSVTLLLPISSSVALSNDRHTATFQVDFNRTVNEKELRETLRDFNVKYVRASNYSSSSQRWNMGIETRDADLKVERELKAAKGVERVRRIVIKKAN